MVHLCHPDYYKFFHCFDPTQTLQAYKTKKLRTLYKITLGVLAVFILSLWSPHLAPDVMSPGSRHEYCVHHASVSLAQDQIGGVFGHFLTTERLVLDLCSLHKFLPLIQI